MVDFVIDNIILKNEQSIFFIIIIIFEKKINRKSHFHPAKSLFVSGVGLFERRSNPSHYCTRSTFHPNRVPFVKNGGEATRTNSVSKPDLPEDPNTQPQAPSCDRLFAPTWIKSKVIVTGGHNKRARWRKKIQWSLLARRDSSSWYPKKPPWSLKPSATCSPLQVSLRLYNSLIINLHFLQYLGNLFFFLCKWNCTRIQFGL